MTWTPEEAAEEQWLEDNAWEETLRCANGHEWETWVWGEGEGDQASDPDCEVCGQPGIREFDRSP